MSESKKSIKSLKMLIVDQNGDGKGLNTVKAKDVTYDKIRNIIGNSLETMPVKLVYKGKKYWIAVDNNGMSNWKQEWFMPFTAGLYGATFEYAYDTSGMFKDEKQKNECLKKDLEFNGIVTVPQPYGQYAMAIFGPTVFIEDVGDEEVFSNYWETVKAA